MTLPTPPRPDSYSERLPAHRTHTVDRDSGAGLADAVDEYVYYSGGTAEQARAVIVAAVRDARAGDVVTVGPVRVHVR